MKLAEYQELATRTAEPRAFHHDYLIPGIVGETGELIGHMAKGYWHQKDVSEKIMYEYGDICWQTALLLQTEGVSEVAPIYKANKPHLDIVEAACHLYESYLMPLRQSMIRVEAQQLWRLLELHCAVVTGYSFDHVLLRNLEKLASRAERGVLQGSGDHR